MYEHINARRSALAPTLGLCLVAAGAAGCAVEQEEPAASIEEHVPGDSWEVLPNPVRFAAEPVSDSIDIITMHEEARFELAKRALDDRTWYAADGERYQALYVAPSGKAFGRRGEAPAWPQPDEEIGAGSIGWIPDAEDFAAADAVLDALEQGMAPDLVDGDRPGQRARITTDITNDRRSRQSSTNSLTSVPLRMIGALSSSGNTGSGGCTGTKIGPRAVLTASHCVMNDNGDITRSGWFNPGQTNTATPNGSFPWSGVYLRDYRIHPKYDYAVIFLADSPEAVGLGWMGVAYWNSASSYAGRGASLHGYPCGPNRSCGAITSQRCKASPRDDKRCDGWMYSHSANLWSNSYMSNDLLQYDHDMSSGQSGSSVYVQLSPGDRRVIAVNTHSTNGVSRGARFRASMWNDVCTWISKVSSQYGTHGTCN